MSNLKPSEIVKELDKYIIGQDKAKRSVAVALRNRWRRQQVPEELRDEIAPKNIILIGPTGVGKTEIARRLSRLTDSPFTKVYRGRIRRQGCRVHGERPGGADHQHLQNPGPGERAG